ncbi:hypothetical protein MKK75_04050 [Methylobacterium sp. J-030]|uniref:hypothetical protein n=1 Tax=Methylobacterium sp. J-030 TaxID=2836627 RepID=UPI001FBAFF6D|nr:hypothetical protein [Methylobacterium sp. J-030]MCJ2067988.1 hypothetical protein [Methylobacterium sp. J-030]
MTNIRIPILCSILALALSVSAFAQTDGGNGGSDPLAVEKVPNTTAVGQTKPPSRDASPTSVKPIERLTPRQAADDAISQQVCRGCTPEPSETGSLTVPVPVVAPPERRDVRLEELQSAPQPKQQSDLDTVALASAHREQAKSVDEKTNGLWQSWVVSVCDGCGDQKPARALKLEDWPNRNVPMTTGSVNPKAPATKVDHAEAKRVEARHHHSLEADLSPENVDAIRRMPQ